MNLYEAMYILDTSLSEDRIKEVIAGLTKEFTERHGEIVKVDEMGKRSLAYPIRKMTDGYYLVVYFRLAPSEISALRARYRLNTDIVRYLIVKRSEGEPLGVPRGRRRPGAYSDEAAGPEEPTEGATPPEGESTEAVSTFSAVDTETPESPLEG